MKTMLLLTAMIFVAASIFAQPANQSKALFPYVEAGKTGYINTLGEVVIKPIFINGSHFSEGLACGRLDGYYCFFDVYGNTVIPAQFDYATPFSDGLALVYVDGQPIYIDHSGKKAFDVITPEAGIFINDRAIIKTASKRFGLVNTRGQLVLDTLYSHIGDFVNGYAVVEITEKSPDDDDLTNVKMGIVNRNGQFIVPPGKYYDIGNYSEGYFKVKIPEANQDSDNNLWRFGFVDTTGQLMLDIKLDPNCWIDGDIHNGLAIVNLYKNWIPEEKGIIYSSSKSYDGFINLKGEIVIQDTLYKKVTDFSCNRAFAGYEYWDLVMINTKGERVGADAFSAVHDQGFVNGLAFVSDDRKWGLIDTNGHFVISPQYNEIGQAGLMNDYFFFFKRIPNESNGDYSDKWGIARKDGSLIVDGVLDYIDPAGFVKELAFCIVDGLPAYINKNGVIVWKGQQNTGRSDAQYNIDYMNRGYFYAISEPDESDLGGFAHSENEAQKITPSMKFPNNKMSITATINPEQTPAIVDVIVANNSKKNIQFQAQDSRLYMKMQAKDKNGQWKDIEYLPNSWCGNSYHILTLKKQQYWSFIAPVYQGIVKTQMRIALTYLDPKKSSNNTKQPKKEITIYSNEFEGSVNPGQFWRKPGYSPAGIMDPYDE